MSDHVEVSRLRQVLSEKGFTPHYATALGAAYVGDSRELLAAVPDKSAALVLTSPPYALRKKKSYGNEDAEQYVEWFLPFATEVLRVLKDDGSFVIEIGGSWMPGRPVRSVYHYELLIALLKQVRSRDDHFRLAQEFFWFNSAKMPGPAQWVTIDRIRCTDAVSTIWWLSKNDNPKADNRRILSPYGDSMKRLLKKGYNMGRRPSGHKVSTKWQKDQGGAIPKNLLSVSNTNSNDIYQRLCREAGIPMHPARFPWNLPQFFVKFLTDSIDDVVIDIFAGSNVTGAVAETLGRPWLAFEQRKDYLEASKFRFGLSADPIIAGAKTALPQALVN